MRKHPADSWKKSQWTQVNNPVLLFETSQVSNFKKKIDGLNALRIPRTVHD